MPSRADTPPGKALVPVLTAEPPVPIPPGLTERQAAFAIAYVSRGDGNASAAAREAGYSREAARQTGYALLHHPGVQSYIQALTALELARSAPIAAQTMRKLALSAKSEFVRQNAAADILDRTGFRPPDRHQHVVSGGVTISIDLGE